jgi:hypothetical protein
MTSPTRGDAGALFEKKQREAKHGFVITVDYIRSTAHIFM